MQITLGTQYDMSGRNHLKKNQNAPRPSEHPRVIKASTRMILVHGQKMYNIFRILIGVPDYSSRSFFLMKRKENSSWHLNRFPDADNIGYTV